ncbi:unnamed protein product [Notodromas monacha]|uniref:Peptidase S1 domain-containing protein n=1 Tax=Notodromas monacha TaxID=399045 RepID=A0A7R9C3E0_9CRUS|nr:unnamed protein product [Notodromas monacha]CAG0925054.1 unnamed protein product [Notodromas monacha]
MQNVLKLIEIPTVPKSTCEEKLRDTRLGPRFKLHPSFICAGGNGIDACKGDGGSPLVCPSLHTGSDVQSIRYVLTGLVAWGIGCAGIPPGVYVNVPYFMPWLEPFLKEYDPGYDYFGHS